MLSLPLLYILYDVMMIKEAFEEQIHRIQIGGKIVNVAYWLVWKMSTIASDES